MKIPVFKFIKEFGFNYTYKYITNTLLFKITKNQNYKEKVYLNLENYLYKRYKDVLVSDFDNQKLPNDFKVWVFWWQGATKDILPKVVNKCIQTIQDKFPDNEVIIIDKNNYKDYVEIPEYIIEKLNKKVITITHFSDILRACLLSKYGGVWLDATIYMTQPIKEDILNYPFYSNKMPSDKKYNHFVSKARWSAFFLAGTKNNPIFVNLRNILFEYWKTHNYLIDYLLVDFCIALSYNKFSSVKKLIDQVPVNNINLYGVADNFFKPFNINLFESFKKDTKLFKLTWKFTSQDADIPDTFYKKLIEV